MAGRRAPVQDSVERVYNEHWQTRNGAFVEVISEIRMPVILGTALTLAGVGLVIASLVVSLACPAAVVLWFGVGLILVGVGSVAISPAAFPATIVLLIVGAGLAIFGYFSTQAMACSPFL